MAALQLLLLHLLPLLLGGFAAAAAAASVAAAAASARPPRQLPPCQIVQTDAFCNDRSLRSAPPDLPRDVQLLDLSHNQLQNLSRQTLAFHTGFRQLNLRANKIHFIQPDLFRDMRDLRVLDLSRNHLNVFALSKVHVGPLTAVESLDLSGNGLYTGMSDYFLSDSPSLSNLSLSSNSITKIAHDAFTGSAALRKVSLHNNVIMEIEDGAFDALDKLAELDLSKNSITCITDFNLVHLQVLNLSKNSLELFQSSRSGVFRLLCLDLSENKMRHFPLLPANNTIEHLDLSRNHLQSLNTADSPQTQNANLALKHLRYLDMSYNRLRSVPQSFFCSMGSLQLLNLSNNCIDSFSITDESLLQTLKIMDLSYNSLQSLTLEAGNRQALEELHLQGNALTTLDHQTFQRLPCLKVLQLQQNRLSVCERNHVRPPGCVSFSSIANLEVLSLAENNLRTLPADAFACSPLRLLDLSLNPGLDMDKDSLSGLEGTLVHLLLRESNISRLNTDLSSLRSLREVDLSNNQLSSLPTWTKEASIESLNLHNNNLVTLEFSTITVLERSLKTLYVGSNPLSCCGNLDFLQLLRRRRSGGLVVPDIEAVTCLHPDHAQPVNIDKVTPQMCRTRQNQGYVVVAVVMALLLLLLTGLLVKCCCLRKPKHGRSFSA